MTTRNIVSRRRRAEVSGLRSEIQALRAAAVLLVVVSHLWPSVLPGGFVGVDVFFAISGFLITSLLLREIDRTGGLSPGAFWARRARRILPAAMVTLLFCAVATVLFVPLTYWQQFLTELRASTAYVQNWHLAHSAVDYFAADDRPSPVEHFWSLSAEEQFYVVWPLLLLFAVGLTRKRSAQMLRRAIVAVIAGVTAVSLGYSLYDTAANPSAAYFITPTRAWEFGLGGLLALLPQIERSPGRGRAALSWAGFAAIAAAAAFYTEKTAFPGDAALLPVLGALAVIAAGSPSRRWAPTRGLELPPVQYLGSVSYSVYLWHWPLLIFAPFVVDRALHPEAGIVILALTILAAALSKLLIEDPVRLGSFLTLRDGRWTFAAAAAGTGVVLVVAGGATSHMRGEVAEAERASEKILAAKPKCFGAASRDPRHPCSNAKLRYQVIPTPIAARRAPNHPCKIIERHDDIQVCEFGAPEKGAMATIAVIGDSHASHWRPSLDFVARAKGWHAYNVTHTSCPFSTGVRDIPEPTRSGCQRWKADLLRWFSRHPEVTHVFAAQLSGGAGIRTTRRDKYAAEVDGYLKAWKTLPATVKRITVIRDTPKMRGDTDTCVLRAMSAHKRAGVACALPRRESLIRDPAVGAARRHPPRVRYVDLTRYFCDSRKCFPVIGGALVYKDATHITSVYGRTLGPYLLRALGYAHDHQRARDGQRRPARLSPAPPTAWPRCFGAAARDPRAQPCVNPRLRHWVVPSPREARGRPNAPCKVIEHSDEVSPCEFGQVVGVPALTIALVGDSHASHWRAALDVAATAKHWRGLSIMKTSCPFSKAFRILVERNRSTACVRWKREIFPWFRRHPEVRTVFVVGLAASDVAHRGGQSEFAAAVAGYASAWKALPTSVERIVVIRDTPIVPHRTRKCVERAIARRRSAGLACAVPRALALHPDPAVAAAARMHSRRVRVMDLTRYFCDSRRCFPVIGGALVYKDTTHITAVFAETVGQFMLRKLGG